jgi:hypothetical protein
VLRIAKNKSLGQSRRGDCGEGRQEEEEEEEEEEGGRGRGGGGGEEDEGKQIVYL